MLSSVLIFVTVFSQHSLSLQEANMKLKIILHYSYSAALVNFHSFIHLFHSVIYTSNLETEFEPVQ